jgi:hypothetical protein
MIKHCKGCGEQIHPKRVEILPKTQTCVNCSGSEKKGAINIIRGERDHTYVETIILEADEYRRLKEAETQINKQSAQLEKLYFDSDDSDIVAENEILSNEFYEINLNDNEYK